MLGVGDDTRDGDSNELRGSAAPVPFPSGRVVQ